MIVLKWIQKNLVVSILLGMVLGFLIGLIVDTRPLRVYVNVLSFFLVYPMMVTLNFKSLLMKGNPKLQLVTQLVNFGYLPLLAYLFGIIFFRDQLSFRLGILLIALLPTSGMTVSWTVMAKGNVQEAIRMIVIGLMLGGLLTPFFINLYLGATITLSFQQILSQIIMIVFIPMILGFLTQWLLKKRYGEATFHKQIKGNFPPISTLAVVLLITLVMSLRAPMLRANPAVLITLLVPITLGYFVMLVSLHFLGKLLFNYEDHVAFMNGTMIRSLSVALAIALTVFEEAGVEVSLVIALAYIVQVQMAAYYVKFSQKSRLQATST